MKLIIGGYAQGKLDYVLRREDAGTCEVWDGALPGRRREETKNGAKKTVLYHFHGWVRERLLQGGCPEEEIAAYLERDPECIVICDEIGNGIVPVDAFERAYRERTGRILVELAAKADEVVRVICGIGQKIK